MLSFVASLAGVVSRSGPIVPVDPAGLNVWQEPQPFAANTGFPCAAFAAAGAVVVAALVAVAVFAVWGAVVAGAVVVGAVVAAAVVAGAAVVVAGLAATVRITVCVPPAV
jgi:hypothetical protein